jgi:hypothetical protein
VGEFVGDTRAAEFVGDTHVGAGEFVGDTHLGMGDFVGVGVRLGLLLTRNF